MDPDRQASILTPSQRRYLDPTQESGVTDDSHERAVRSRIRDRLREGVHDFRLLLHELENQDRRQVFGGPIEGPVEEGTHAWDEEVLESVQAAFGFLYLCYYTGHPEMKISDARFRRALERGIAQALEIEYPDSTVREVLVDIEVDIRGELLAEALNKLENGEPMTRNEVMRLFEAGEFPKEIILQSVDSDVKDP